MSDAERPDRDDRLIDDLRAAAKRLDPPPADLNEVSAGLLAWRDPDAELAALVADSRQLAGSVRGAQREVLLQFEADGVAITVEVGPAEAGRCRLIGQIDPGAPGSVDVRRILDAGASPPAVRTDEWGRFEAFASAGGAVSLRWRPDDPAGRAVTTAWVSL